MCNPIKINENINISKNDILNKYKKFDKYFRDCLDALYGEKNNITINCYLPCNIINKQKYKLEILKLLEDKTGVYIFIDNENIPVYIGIGGQKQNKQDLKTRVSQELRAYVTKGKTTSYSKDTGATLSKNIQEIESILQNQKITPDNSIELIKSFSLLTITVGEVTIKSDVLKSRALETILIALFHPKYNK